MVEQFCKSILQIVGRNSKALANLIMGLASQTFARSVVEISLSNCYHYQYSSINKAIVNIDKPIQKRRSKGQSIVEASRKMSQREVEKKFTC